MAKRATNVERFAEELLRKHQCEIPVNVEKLAKAIGCVVVKHEFEDDHVSGLLIREDNKVIIAVNRDDGPMRKRFTIAHEIGHLVMHSGRPLLVDAAVRVNARTPTAGFATEREETEANQFAAALLMPAERVRSLFKGSKGMSTANIAQLAKMFGVSESAMQFRLVNLGLLIPH